MRDRASGGSSGDDDRPSPQRPRILGRSKCLSRLLLDSIRCVDGNSAACPQLGEDVPKLDAPGSTQPLISTKQI